VGVDEARDDEGSAQVQDATALGNGNVRARSDSGNPTRPDHDGNIPDRRAIRPVDQHGMGQGDRFACRGTLRLACPSAGRQGESGAEQRPEPQPNEMPPFP
jgi:hypothetical protein